MQKIFYPKDVAVIGVSESETNLARNIVNNLINWEFKGGIFPVGPKGGSVFGRKIYKSVLEIEEEIDLAAVLTPAHTIPQIIEECNKKGIKRMCISSGGFAEFGEEGEGIDRIVKEKAREYGIKFVGPNGIAVINAEIGLCLPFPPIDKIPRVGDVSVMAQSGGVGLSILVLLGEENLFFNKFISLGNKAVLDEVDFLEYLKYDEGTKIIIMYLESIRRGKEFIEVCRSIDKPVLLYKANRTSQANKAAHSHTAALANDDLIVDAACKQAGVLRVYEITRLAYLARMFLQPRIKGRKIIALSPAGGHTVIAADCGEMNGFEFPSLNENIIIEMEKYARAGVIRLGNPLDLGDTFSAEAALKAIELAFQDEDIDAAVMTFLRRPGTFAFTGAFSGMARNIIPDLENLIKKYQKPYLLVLISDPYTFDAAKKAVSFPVFPRPEEAFEILAVYRDWCIGRFKPSTNFKEFKVNKERVKKILNKYNEGKIKDLDAFEVLRCYGIKTVKPYLARDLKDVIRISKKVGKPWVMKISSGDILHKSDVGGIAVGINSLKEAKGSFKKIISNVLKNKPEAKIEGVLVYKMAKNGREVIIGVKRDECFGSVVMFGLGGVFVEVLKDVSIRVAPVTQNDAESMIEEIKGHKLLEGIRCESPVDMKSILENILRISQLVAENSEVSELDINPFIVYEKGGIAVDVRMIVKGGLKDC